jgi:hypothetical protein
MAKRYSSKKGRNIEPAPMTFTLSTPDTTGGAYTVDLSQVASLVNRRFYRQGINWAVGGFKIFSTGTGAFSISKIPNTWVTANAWKKAFEAWNRQQKAALADAGGQSAAAAFRDFKVYMDVDHVAAGIAANLLPIDASGNAALPGEWEASQIVLPNNAGVPGDTQERFLHMVGNNVNGTVSRGVLEGYADSRAYPQSPDPVSPDLTDPQNWLARMFNTGDEISDVLENATDRNDNLPYDQVNYPGGQTNMPGLEYHDVAQLVSYSGSTNVGVQTLKGGNFPCGLIRFNWTPDGAHNVVIQINLVPGSHRGYLCEKMGDM